MWQKEKRDVQRNPEICVLSAMNFSSCHTAFEMQCRRLARQQTGWHTHTYTYRTQAADYEAYERFMILMHTNRCTHKSLAHASTLLNTLTRWWWHVEAEIQMRLKHHRKNGTFYALTTIFASKCEYSRWKQQPSLRQNILHWFFQSSSLIIWMRFW